MEQNGYVESTSEGSRSEDRKISSEANQSFQTTVNSLPKEDVVQFVQEHVDEFVEGWHQLIGSIYRRHSSSNRIVDLDDMKQQAVLKVLECLPKFDFDRTKGKTNYNKLTNFLITCVGRELISHSFKNSFSVNIPSGSKGIISQETKDMSIPTCAGLAFAEAPDCKVEDHITAIELIDRFDQDGILEMYHIYNMNQREIAEKLETTTSTVSRKLNQIKESIRKYAQDLVEKK